MVEHVLSTLNNFHSSIKFTYETESGNKLYFLDMQLIHAGDNIETCIFRKSTNPDIYIHWNSFTPFQWKYSTLKTLVYCAYIVCLDNQHLESELNYLRKVFHNFNSYLHWFITNVVNEVNNDFPSNIQTCIVYTGAKLSSQLKNISDSTPFEEQHIVYHSSCNAENCNEKNIGESV